MAGKGPGSGQQGRAAGTEEEGALEERYMTILVAKLTEADLRELQALLRDQFDEDGNIDPAGKARFEGKLRRYLHEEVITREMPGIEALIRGLKPGDLRRRGRG